VTALPDSFVARALEQVNPEHAGDPEAIYSEWWCRGTDGPKSDTVPEEASTTYFDAEEWNVLRKDPDGSLTVARDSGTGIVRAGEWTYAGRSSRVYVRRRQAWDSDGFAWRQSRSLPSISSRRWRIRAYIPISNGNMAREYLNDASEALDEAFLWFQAKACIARSPRSDGLVIWLTANDAYDALEKLVKVAPSSVKPAIPPLAFPYGSLGLAFDPPRGESFGWLASSAAAEVVINQKSRSTLIERWGLAATYRGLFPQKPWRHMGVDPAGFWQKVEHI
jgi:hypothetical protein